MAAVDCIELRLSLPGLNEYDNMSRGHWSKSAGTKKEHTQAVADAAAGHKIRGLPANLLFEWHVKKSKNGQYKDPDNIAFAVKFILDGFQQAGVIPKDTRKEIGNIYHEFVWGAEEDMVRVRTVERPDFKDC